MVIIIAETLIPTGRSNKVYDPIEQPHHPTPSQEYDPRIREDPRNKRNLSSNTKMGKSKSQSSQLRGGMFIHDDRQIDYLSSFVLTLVHSCINSTLIECFPTIMDRIFTTTGTHCQLR